MKKFSLALIAIILVVVSTFSGFVVQGGNEQTVEPEVKTISEIGSPTIAGTGAYYDDGMLKYANTGNTIGYFYDQSASLLEFDIIFDYMVFPGWFSLTFKADGFDRTQSANLTQKGYSIVVFPSGEVQVWKEGLAGVGGFISGLSNGVKYRFKIGVYNENSATRIFFSVDGVEIVNAVDNSNPYLTGEWFNICGDGGTSARLFSTKKEVVPNYYTYTLSTMGDYPTATETGATYDKYKNITLYGGTIGWGQLLRDFSLEVKMNWERFVAGANVWVALRANYFDRATSPNISCYSVRVGSLGAVEIYKNGAFVSGGGWSFVMNTDYVFEFGCVDLDENRTMVFVNINGMPVTSFVDYNNPIKSAGYVNFNGDGDVMCHMSSVSTKLTPLKTKVKQTDTEYVVETYFNNTMSYVDMKYADFSDYLLDAILLNDTAVKDINNVYYALNGSEKINAIDLIYVNNKLVINVAKVWYSKENNVETDFILNELCLKKTGDGRGLICPSGYKLKQTYYYNV